MRKQILNAVKRLLSNCTAKDDGIYFCYDFTYSNDVGDDVVCYRNLEDKDDIRFVNFMFYDEFEAAHTILHRTHMNELERFDEVPYSRVKEFIASYEEEYEQARIRLMANNLSGTEKSPRKVKISKYKKRPTK